MPFTQAPYFQEMFEATIETMKRTLADDQSRYSQDWASTGLSGLANGTIRKASRIFDLVVMEMPGKDKQTKIPLLSTYRSGPQTQILVLKATACSL